MSSSQQKWLTYREAARVLKVDTRTINRWIRDSDRMREALGVVRRGKQWLIPNPKSLTAWKTRVKSARQAETPGGQILLREARKLANQNKRFQLQLCRIWLASHLKPPTEEASQDRDAATALLFELCAEILAVWPKSQAFDLDHLQHLVRQNLSRRRMPEKLLSEVMHYWPTALELRRIPSDWKELKTLRQRFDYKEGVEKLGLDNLPRNELLGPLLHADFRTHINDTKEKLPLRCIDMREPQKGIAVRTVKQRHPKNGTAEKQIIGTIHNLDPGVSDDGGKFRTASRRNRD